MINKNKNIPGEDQSKSSGAAKISRTALQLVGGVIPFAGGIFSSIASLWSENTQEKANRFYKNWIKMLHDELQEKEQTLIEIMARLDLHDEAICNRVESSEYQSLVRKTFREWSGAESVKKRVFIRNILANAASTNISSDDVVRLYIDWINMYSELHFVVIGAIYNTKGISRGDIWKKIGKQAVKENSAEADLYKLLFRDLTTGSIIRQHREVDYEGRFIVKKGKRSNSAGSTTMKSAFDTTEQYELTELGQQFIHYAMTDLPLKISFDQ